MNENDWTGGFHEGDKASLPGYPQWDGTVVELLAQRKKIRVYFRHPIHDVRDYAATQLVRVV